MTQKTMSEKDQFLQAWEMECQITSKVLAAYPAAKADYKPAEISRTAKELAWTFVLEQYVLQSALTGEIDFAKTQLPAPATFKEVLDTFAKVCAETTAKVKAAPDAALEKSLDFPVGPGKMAPVPVSRVLWMMLMDSIHHRGQLWVYLRMFGARVPSIYGPTADEPWF